MENNNLHEVIEPAPVQPTVPPPKSQFHFTRAQQFIAVWLIGIIVGFSVGHYGLAFPFAQRLLGISTKDGAALMEMVAPTRGTQLHMVWGDMGSQLIKAGVIDRQKFEAVYAQRGGLDDQAKQLLDGTTDKPTIITRENAGLILNLLWALGLGNKNDILDAGPMMDKQYGGAGGFASTGGWNLAAGQAMNHYSHHAFVTLTSDQQGLVQRVAQNIYRPCCNNPTHFPDCNHGMAMLGALELMASQGADEATMYHTALTLNAYWFPDTYATIATYLQKQKRSWDKADPKELLGASFSSASGYRTVLQNVEPVQNTSGGSCGV